VEACADQVIQLRQAARLEAEALDERAAIWMFGPGRVSSGQGQASAAVRAREIDRGFRYPTPLRSIRTPRAANVG
jgi:hypothetical protein